MRVMIFGGVGSIGRELGKLVCDEGGYSIAVDNDDERLSLVDPRVKIEYASTMNRGEVIRLITENKPDIIVNLAHPWTIDTKDTYQFFSAYITGTIHVLDAAIHRQPASARIPVVSVGWHTKPPDTSVLGAALLAQQNLFKVYRGTGLAKIVNLPCVLSTEGPTGGYMSILSRLAAIENNEEGSIVEYKGENFSEDYVWCTAKQAAKFVRASFNSNPNIVGTFPFSNARDIIRAASETIHIERIVIRSQNKISSTVNRTVGKQSPSQAMLIAVDVMNEYIEMRNRAD